ncbi:hypothetical protein AJ80_01662 [Polytolypa hystricis UAMH7299]|uniref:Uncharacterized protein n=1 Tax=Polytolypa hystricis (strain UAMH7299) TaxID=1447883 RepID=A0A2B7YYF3_POLH7|nr:hypothetical protein AJ80_01662 [Polytolypa hystricis UAMH7299]
MHTFSLLFAASAILFSGSQSQDICLPFCSPIAIQCPPGYTSRNFGPCFTCCISGTGNSTYHGDGNMPNPPKGPASNDRLIKAIRDYNTLQLRQDVPGAPDGGEADGGDDDGDGSETMPPSPVDPPGDGEGMMTRFSRRYNRFALRQDIDDGGDGGDVDNGDGGEGGDVDNGGEDNNNQAVKDNQKWRAKRVVF